MALHMLAPFVPRTRRVMALLIPSLLVAASVGCAHKRQSMRPVYVTPAPALRKTLRSGRRFPLGRLRQASLQDELRPYVDNPDDLFSPPKADRPWKYVVLHHSASPTGGYDAIDREHRKVLGWSGCGYHF